jgi:hypothetical protein
MTLRSFKAGGCRRKRRLGLFHLIAIGSDAVPEPETYPLLVSDWRQFLYRAYTLVTAVGDLVRRRSS